MAHTILVAFAVNGETRDDAMRTLGNWLPAPWRDGHRQVDCWWIAEDDRTDGSDNDSAVFVPMGMQAWFQAVVRGGGPIPCKNTFGGAGE